MISKVNVTLLRQFQDFYCLSKHMIWLTHDFSSYNYYFSLNHFQLPVFIISKVNITLLRQFLDLIFANYHGDISVYDG